MTLRDVIYPISVFLLAGFVKGVIGLGLPAISVGLLGMLMPPVQAASLLVVPSTVTNFWQLVAGQNIRAAIKRLWPMHLGVCFGVWLGSGTLVADSSGRGRFWLGILLALYGIFGLIARQLTIPRRLEIWLGPLVGLVTGLATAATGMFTLPMVPYISGLGLDREDLVQALGLSFTVCTLALAADLAGGGTFDITVLTHSTLAVLPSLAGMFAGQFVRTRISAILFRRCFFVGMLALGLELATH